VALGVVGLVITSVVAFYVASFATAQQSKEVASIAVVKPPPPTDNFNFTDDFRVNTADTGEPHFIKLRLSLGYEQGNPALTAELGQRSPQLRDMINLILAGKTMEDCAPTEQVDCAKRSTHINHTYLSDGKISAVYFNEFIVS
jgi:flagellar FliL protein